MGDNRMKSELYKMVSRWHSWNETRDFNSETRERIKGQLKAMIVRKFSHPNPTQ